MELDVSPQQVIIVNPVGRVVLNKRYHRPLTWEATSAGQYFLKIWSGQFEDYYHVTVSGPPDSIESLQQLIWSPLCSNKDGYLFDKGPKMRRKNNGFIQPS